MTLVTVTPMDIVSGIRGNSLFCPISLAVSRAMGRPMRAGVTMVTDGYCQSPIPPEVSNWLIAFDQGKWVPPIQFWV